MSTVNDIFIHNSHFRKQNLLPFITCTCLIEKKILIIQTWHFFHWIAARRQNGFQYSILEWCSAVFSIIVYSIYVYAERSITSFSAWKHNKPASKIIFYLKTIACFNLQDVECLDKHFMSKLVGWQVGKVHKYNILDRNKFCNCFRKLLMGKENFKL